MIIRKDSWHYKVWHFTFDTAGRRIPGETTLCAYFWRVVTGLAQIVFFVALSAMIVVGILGFLGWAAYTYPRPLGFIAALLVVSTGVGFAVQWLVRAIIARIDDARENAPPKPPREPGVLRAYLRAKKEKVCPIVEFRS